MPQAHTPRHAWSRVLPAAIAATGLLAACTSTPTGTDKVAAATTAKVSKPSTEKTGAGLIPNGGSNLVPNGGSNLIPNGGSNLIPNGGSNLVPNGGASIVGNGGASFTGKHGALGAQLRDLAAIAHTRANAGIIANNASGVVSNNNAGIVASNGAGLIANNTAGIIANNASGVIAGNTGSLVPNGGASYALFQAVAPAFQVTAMDGETAPQEAPVPDGTTAIVFDKVNGDRRIVVVNAQRQPLEQQQLTGTTINAAGVITASHTDRALVYGNTQAKRGHLIYDETYDDTGAITSLKHQPSELVEPNSGLDVRIDELAFTVAPPAGSFAIRFLHLKAKETGTITQVVRNVGGKLVGVDLADPLSSLGGSSTFETDDGKPLFTRKTEIVAGGGLHLTLTMQEGYAFDLTRASRTAPFVGTVSQNGTKIGTATLTARADASIEYQIAFDGEATPFVLRIPEAAPAAKP